MLNPHSTARRPSRSISRLRPAWGHWWRLLGGSTLLLMSLACVQTGAGDGGDDGFVAEATLLDVLEDCDPTSGPGEFYMSLFIYEDAPSGTTLLDSIERVTFIATNGDKISLDDVWAYADFPTEPGAEIRVQVDFSEYDGESSEYGTSSTTYFQYDDALGCWLEEDEMSCAGAGAGEPVFEDSLLLFAPGGCAARLYWQLVTEPAPDA